MFISFIKLAKIKNYQMNYFSKTFTVIAIAALSVLQITAQEVVPNKQEDFNPFTYRQGTSYRSASGKPGPEYWQNAADYQIEASLDDVEHTITGKITVTYTNNSPEDLDFIWMYLEQNRFKPDSRGFLTTPIQGNRYAGDVEGGYEITALEAKVDRSSSSKYIIDDTRMQVFFNEPVKAK